MLHKSRGIASTPGAMLPAHTACNPPTLLAAVCIREVRTLFNTINRTTFSVRVLTADCDTRNTGTAVIIIPKSLSPETWMPFWLGLTAAVPLWGLPGYCILGFFSTLSRKRDCSALFIDVNPSRTAVPFWGQTTQIISNLSPKRDCGPKRVNTAVLIVIVVKSKKGLYRSSPRFFVSPMFPSFFFVFFGAFASSKAIFSFFFFPIFACTYYSYGSTVFVF